MSSEIIRTPRDIINPNPIRSDVYQAFRRESELLASGRGAYTYGMEENAYCEALMSYTVHLFNGESQGMQETALKSMRSAMRWSVLGKYLKAHPHTKEATAYNMLDDARCMEMSRVDALIDQKWRGLISPNEATARIREASARCDAVSAVADAFLPGGRLALFQVGDRLLQEQQDGQLL